ncbi:MAG: right-handed parallel beta-helix repeat-containing protein [Bacteroidota bacterium]
MSKYKISLFSLLLILISFSISCRKETAYDTSFKTLGFSTDSVLFDTVFTTVGSATKRIRVYNTSKNWIKINSIQLGRGQQSNFRINVDGISGVSHTDIEIAPKDSLFIFINVTVDPNNSNSPLVITDSIIFNTNDNIQDVKLVAWGQDAYYHVPNNTIVLSPTQALRFSYAGCATPWKTDKPHVIYGYTVVDEDSTLTIPAGAKIHLHKNAVLWVYDGGTLKVNEFGTSTDQKVVFQGDRLEYDYKDLAGQWGAIWLSKGSKNNVINQSIIKNGTIGIQVDTLGNSSNPTLTLKNTIIKNMSGAAILAQGSKIHAENCVFANCGQYAVALTIGGNYEFYHCTIGNYWNVNTRQTPSLVLNNYYKDIHNTSINRPLEKAYFGNCIIYGANANEIGLDNSGETAFNFKFENCLIAIDPKVNTSDANNYVNIIKNENPGFADTDQKINNFKLNSGSPAIDKGDISLGTNYPLDIEGASRTTDIAPDLGAYEFTGSK